MIPSRRWFPGTLQERAAWFDNFKTQFSTLYISLGLTLADNTVVANDNIIVQFVAEAATAVDAFAEANRQYRYLVMEGDIGSAMPLIPDYTAPGAPSEVPAGIFERLDNLVKRIRLSPTYTDQAGALLGIIPSNLSRPPEADLKPVIKASESQNSYRFNVNVTRLGMPQFKVQIQRMTKSTWQDVVFTTSNPAVVTVTPTIPGDPERIFVRAILQDRQADVGIPSDPTYVTVNP
jgi:hypothetical protein